MNWFQKSKEYFIKHKGAILVVVCFFLMFMFLFVWRKHPKVTPLRRDNLDLLRKVDSITDLNNRYWARIKAITISAEEARMRNDSLARALKLKAKFIKGQDIYISRTDTSFINLPSVVIHDSLSGNTIYKVEKKDDYVKITASVSKLGGKIDFSSIDTLTRVEYVKNPLIGRTKRFVYLHNASPYNKITEGMSYTTKEKDVFLSIGPVISYDFITKKPSLGIGIQIPIIKFRR